MDALPRPFDHPDFRKNQSRITRGVPCAVCGKEVETDAKGTPLSPRTRMIRVVDGGARFASPTEVVSEAGDMGYFPVGSECLRRHPALKELTEKR